MTPLIILAVLNLVWIGLMIVMTRTSRRNRRNVSEALALVQQTRETAASIETALNSWQNASKSWETAFHSAERALALTVERHELELRGARRQCAQLCDELAERIDDEERAHGAHACADMLRALGQQPRLSS